MSDISKDDAAGLSVYVVIALGLTKHDCDCVCVSRDLQTAKKAAQAYSDSEAEVPLPIAWEQPDETFWSAETALSDFTIDLKPVR